MASAQLAEHTLALLLGAEEFPDYPGLTGGPAFAGSTAAFRQCLVEQYGQDWFSSRVLDLFDSDEPVAQQMRHLARFCAEHPEARRLLIYYVGHGGFLDTRDYYLALRSTAKDFEHLTGLEVRNLALTLNRRFPGKQVVLLLDCCFAGEAVAHFEHAGSAGEHVEAATRRVFRGEGTALLCASSKDEPAISASQGGCTQFSECLVEVLRQGLPDGAQQLSLQDLHAGRLHLLPYPYAIPRPHPGGSGDTHRHSRCRNAHRRCVRSGWRHPGGSRGEHRLHGIDAPESSQQCRQWPCGRRSAFALADPWAGARCAVRGASGTATGAWWPCATRAG